jgi:hypothetical protein
MGIKNKTIIAYEEKNRAITTIRRFETLTTLYFKSEQMNVLSSKGRNQACLGYAESRETTNLIERFKNSIRCLAAIGDRP